MIRSTHIQLFGLTTFAWGLLLAFAPLAPQKSLFSLQAVHAVADTLPDESFDEPFETFSSNSERKTLVVQEADSSKVIPLVSLAVDSTFVQLKEIPKDYNGFKIELMTVQTELPPEHDLFFQHGNLSMEMLPDSTYSYTLGAFQERPKAERFMYNLLIDRYPDARVVEYEEGERTY
ncbi:MAG TPA: hypothetical protein VJ933_12585 [Phaeodactylibacter sp.]|nr:hypothetical protein [Phaeodactylibacter sp.]